MDCTGALKDIFGFYRDVRAMDRLVRIEKIVLKNDSDLMGRVSMRTEALIFYRPQAGQATGGANSEASRRMARDVK
jgi:hypothetical protein